MSDATLRYRAISEYARLLQQSQSQSQAQSQSQSQSNRPPPPRQRVRRPLTPDTESDSVSAIVLPDRPYNYQPLQKKRKLGDYSRAQCKLEPLKLQLAYCDGGAYDVLKYRLGNMLMDDDSVYCTEKYSCCIVLQHETEQPFTLECLEIRAPEKGYTSPVSEGVITITDSADFDSALQTIALYPRVVPLSKTPKRNDYNSFLRRFSPVPPPRDGSNNDSDSENNDDDDDDNDNDDSDINENESGESAERVDHDDEGDTPALSHTDSNMLIRSRSRSILRSRADDNGDEDEDEDKDEDEDIVTENPRTTAADRDGDSQPPDSPVSDGNELDWRSIPPRRMVTNTTNGSNINNSEHDHDCPFDQENSDTEEEEEEDSEDEAVTQELLNAEGEAARRRRSRWRATRRRFLESDFEDEFVAEESEVERAKRRPVDDKLEARDAYMRFVVRNHRTFVVFNPPRYCRNVVLKLWGSRIDNVDIQAVLGYGYYGKRMFPANQMR